MCLNAAVFLSKGIMDNGPAANANFARSLQASGDYISDMGEVSDLIKEDYDDCDGPLETEDLRATAPAISETMTRGHMKPKKNTAEILL